MATICIGGHELFFTRPMKVEGGPVLLLIHGAGGTHLDWPKEVQRIPGTTIFNLDLPGHGRSTGPGKSSIDDYADVVQEFMEVKSLTGVSIAGHSMGGAIAQTLALRRYPQMAKLAVVGSSAKLQVSPEILAMASSDPDVVISLISRLSWGSDVSNPLARIGRKNMRLIDPDVLNGDLNACNCFDIRAELRKINIPTLVISGTEDMMTPLKHGRYLADNVMGARFIAVEGAGHFLMLQKPKLVADALAEFVSL